MNEEIQVIEVNEGPKIPYEQDRTRLYFNDELMINCKKYQKDMDVDLDILRTKDGTLAIGSFEDALTYVAQVHIPKAEYKETQTQTPDDEHSTGMTREKLDINMSKVVLKLYALKLN